MSSLGLLAAVRGLNKYLGMVNRSSMFYFKPKMSQSLSTEDRYKGLNDYFRLMLLLGGLGSILVVLFSYEVVWLLYSREFLRVTSVIFIFVLSQYISSVQIGYMFSVVGMAKMKIHSLAILVSTPFAVIIPYFYLMYEPAALGIIYQSVFPFAKMTAAELKVVLGLISIGLGGLTVVALRILIYGTYLSKVHQVMMNRSNLILLVLGSGLIIFSNYLLPYALGYRIGYAFLVIIAYILLLNKQEKNWVIKTVKEKILRR